MKVNVGVLPLGGKTMNCIKCNSPNTKLNGFYRDHQKYKCNCRGKQFTERSFSFFSRHRFPDYVISNAILLNHQISTRMVKHYFRQNNIHLSHVSVYNWSKKFDKKLSNLRRVCKVEYTDIWHVDEKFIKVRGSKDDFAYLWVVEDTNNNIIAVHVTDRRDCNGAKQVFRKALLNAGFIPKVVVSDGLQGYKKAVRKIFGRKCRHVIRHFETKAIVLNRKVIYLSNNRIESLNSKINLWYKRFRGFKSLETANLWCEGWMYFYNLLRPRVYQEEKIKWREAISLCN